MAKERIISLLPSATEILFALGAGPEVVGTTHECPEFAGGRVQCTANMLPPGMSAAEIDAAVSASLSEDPHTIYRLDVGAVRGLAPTVIVTQSLCAVCAVPESAVQAVACTLPKLCRVVSADPHTLPELFESIAKIAASVGRQKEGETVVRQLKERLARVSDAVRGRPRKRVLVLEWPDPPYAPGHWVPDMIDTAGGTCVLGKSGEKSVRVTWEQLMSAAPDIIVNAFCGYELEDNQKEVDKISDKAEWKTLSKNATVFATNASAFYSRPGPRLVDGTEILAYVVHGLEQFRPKKGSASILKNGKWVDLADV